MQEGEVKPWVVPVQAQRIFPIYTAANRIRCLFECLRALLGGFDERRGSDVAGHDDDRVLEVDGASLRVGQAAVVEELQQDIEDVWMSLLDLIKEHDLVRTAANGLGELAALLVADVARRSTQQARHGELLHVLAHVDAHQRLLVVEQEFGKGPGELRLPHAGGSQEDE